LLDATRGLVLLLSMCAHGERNSITKDKQWGLGPDILGNC